MYLAYPMFEEVSLQRAVSLVFPSVNKYVEVNNDKVVANALFLNLTAKEPGKR